MALFSIGDIQGCHDELCRLLDRLGFDPARDRLWLTGDLVNRGPDSLAVLRLLRGLGAAALTVLGNHDLHLLAVAADPRRLKPRKDAGLLPVLQAPDAGELLDWLRRQPLLHHDARLKLTLIHAGLPPDWDLAQARACAREVEARLRGPDWPALLAEMYGDEPERWDPALEGAARWRFTINCLTRLRYCRADGRLALDFKGAPQAAPRGLQPWFALPQRRSRGERIVFGHWSTLGRVEWAEAQVWGLDTGCLWGGALTALRLDPPPFTPTCLPCTGHHRPSRA